MLVVQQVPHCTLVLASAPQLKTSENSKTCPLAGPDKLTLTVKIRLLLGTCTELGCESMQIAMQIQHSSVGTKAETASRAASGAQVQHIANACVAAMNAARWVHSNAATQEHLCGPACARGRLGAYLANWARLSSFEQQTSTVKALRLSFSQQQCLKQARRKEILF